MIFTIEQQIERLEQLLQELQRGETVSEKIAILDQQPEVIDYLARARLMKSFLERIHVDDHLAIKSILAIGQGDLVLKGIDADPGTLQKVRLMLHTLNELEQFYDTMGGIVGYHLTILRLLAHKKIDAAPEGRGVIYLQPVGSDLTKKDTHIHQAIRWGIESMPVMAEIYPVGGAGDRLNLMDELSHEPLPAAQLQFGGRSLLEGMIRDLQAREYLHFKLCNKQVITPIVLMTSFEKDNDQHMRAICQSKGWFGRPKESFIFITQPLVPVITKEGQWALSEPLKLILKPGGHGVLWKLMLENGVFDTLTDAGRKKALVRQINNPVAGVDHGLLAFAGLGCKNNKAFGFASCPRKLRTPEGVDIVVEKQTEIGIEYCLTNIEYTDFAKRGIQDVAAEHNHACSAFPSNTNILFADLRVVEKTAATNPIPGLLINMKTKVSCLDHEGAMKSVEAGRLESTMQNIADYIVDEFPKPLDDLQNLRSFITFNERSKTISVTKSSYAPGQDIHGTPEGCFYDLLKNHAELLKNECGFEIPALGTEEEFMSQGPAFILWYHPALGPLYDVIGQKMRGGVLRPGAELILEIAELDLSEIDVEGSLFIEAENVLGSNAFGEGKCCLRRVKVRNKGIDRQATQEYWKNHLKRKEVLHIVLKGNAEFFAEDVTFDGSHSIEVPSGHRLTATQKGTGIDFHMQKIEQPSWSWTYAFDAESRIKLTK